MGYYSVHKDNSKTTFWYSRGRLLRSKSIRSLKWISHSFQYRKQKSPSEKNMCGI